MSIYEKVGEAKPCGHVHNHMYTRESGGMLPQEILVFRLL